MTTTELNLATTCIKTLATAPNADEQIKLVLRRNSEPIAPSIYVSTLRASVTTLDLIQIVRQCTVDRGSLCV